ncbi:MAG: hypothetical protein WC291_03135, partial [Thermodesulfovibrionales bacterium]
MKKISASLISVVFVPLLLLSGTAFSEAAADEAMAEDGAMLIERGEMMVREGRLRMEEGSLQVREGELLTE